MQFGKKFVNSVIFYQPTWWFRKTSFSYRQRTLWSNNDENRNTVKQVKDRIIQDTWQSTVLKFHQKLKWRKTAHYRKLKNWTEESLHWRKPCRIENRSAKQNGPVKPESGKNGERYKNKDLKKKQNKSEELNQLKRSRKTKEEYEPSKRQQLNQQICACI